LRREQVKLLQRVFAQEGEDAVNGWLAINHALGQKPASNPGTWL
jgi:hypothetical protein